MQLGRRVRPSRCVCLGPFPSLLQQPAGLALGAEPDFAALALGFDAVRLEEWRDFVTLDVGADRAVCDQLVEPRVLKFSDLVERSPRKRQKLPMGRIC
jgi:hypothetical protein